MHPDAAVFVYGQYLKSEYTPVGAAAIAELDDTASAPIATAATINGRKDFLMRDPSVGLNGDPTPEAAAAWDDRRRGPCESSRPYLSPLSKVKSIQKRFTFSDLSEEGAPHGAPSWRLRRAQR